MNTGAPKPGAEPASRAFARYHRQMLLPGFGVEGQRRLAESCALVVGCGALGCAIADSLARAGVGRLVLVDRDTVEWTNLQRQVLFDERDAREGAAKAEAARRRLMQINSAIEVEARVRDLHAGNIATALDPRPDVILDGTDNFEARFLLNDLAVSERVPYVYGGVVGTRGLAMTVAPGRGACLRCVFEHPPRAGSEPTCDTAGVLGPAVQMIAAAQSADAISLLIGRPDAVWPGVLEIDLWRGVARRTMSGARRAGCPCCGTGRFEFLDAAAGAGSSVTLCGRGAVQVTPATTAAIDLPALARRLGAHGPFRAVGPVLHGELAGERGDTAGAHIVLTVFDDGRAIVRGTSSTDRARTIYDRYVGR